MQNEQCISIILEAVLLGENPRKICSCAANRMLPTLQIVADQRDLSGVFSSHRAGVCYFLSSLVWSIFPMSHLLILRRLYLSLVFVFLQSPLWAQDHRVSTADELVVALRDMQGGTIVLAPGRYGDLVLRDRSFKNPITLRAEVPRKAIFGQVRLMNSSNLQFEGIRLEKQFRVESSKNIAIRGCLSDNMLYFRNVSHLRIQDCDVSGGQFGVIFNSVADFEIRQSRVGKVSEDVMRVTGDSHDGLIEGNILDDVISYPPTHPDLIQMFGAQGKTPARITIRRNLLRDDHATGSPKRTAQGIFVSDPAGEGYRDILIEENVINTRSANTIYINGGQKNVVVRNNTLLPGVGDGGAIIRLVGKARQSNSGTSVEDNIAKQILDETKDARVRQNYLYGRGAKIPALFSGTGARWQDFLPVLGTGPDKPGLGATEFLRELLAAQKPGAKGGPRLGPDWSE